MTEEETKHRIDELKARLGADPGSRIFYQLAEELRKSKQPEEAEKVLRDGLVKHPAYLSAWISLGRVLKDTGRSTEAIGVLNRAFELDRQNVVVARLLGEAYSDTGDDVEAIKKYKLLAALHPADDEVHDRISALEEKLGAQGKLESPGETGPPRIEPVTEATAPAMEAETAAPLEEDLSPPRLAEEPAEEAPPVAEEPAEEPAEEVPPVAEEPAEEEFGAPSFPLEEPGGAENEPPLFSEGAATAEPEMEPLEEEEREPESLVTPDMRAPSPTEELGFDEDAAEPWEREETGEPDVVATVTMGDLYARQGHVEQAREIYRKVLDREPDHEEARRRLDSIEAEAPPALPDDEYPFAGEEESEALASEPAGSEMETESPRRKKIDRLENWLSKMTR